MPLSNHPTLPLAATIFATIFVGFGFNAIYRPDHALSFFEFSAPLLPADKAMVESLMVVYGIRDIFIGVSIYAASFFGNKKTLGSILIAGSAVAFVDGFACKAQGNGVEWNHWGYAPMLTAVGVVLMGFFDR